MSNLMLTVALGMKGKMMRFMNEEKGEVNIVTTVVLIGIAVTLALVFKEKIGQLLETLITAVSAKAESAVQ